MKGALKAKDKTRAILTELTVLEKQSQPVQTKAQLYKLLEKRQNACKAAAEEFQKAGRADLVSQENEQIRIIQGFIDESPPLSTDKTVAAVQNLIRWMQTKGSNPNPKSDKKAIKYLFQEGGALHDKIVDKAFVSQTFERLVNELPPWNPSMSAKNLSSDTMDKSNLADMSSKIREL
ncbi:MAG: hypothetical protein LQ348_000423 [Seirophora lacunosa]|nr:MAG: hypothetical protein LQ348_000423 [Seirophora lacunosa]